jgi:hypothetical protein
VQLLTAGVPCWAVACAGIDLACGIPGSAAIGQAASHCEIPWFGHFAVAHRAFAIAHSGVYARLVGEHWRGNGGEKKYCGTKRFDFGHYSFSCLIEGEHM